MAIERGCVFRERILGKKSGSKAPAAIKKINILDLNNGFSLFKESIKEKKSIISSMYC